MNHTSIIKSIIFAAIALAAGGAWVDCLFTGMPFIIGLKAETPMQAIAKPFEKGL